MEYVVQNNLAQFTSTLLEINESFLHVSESVNWKRSDVTSMNLNGLEWSHPANESHQPVVVWLELLFGHERHSENLDVRTCNLDELVKQFEVLVVLEQVEHLFKTQLVVQFSPRDVLVVDWFACVLQFIDDHWLVALEPLDVQQVELVFDLGHSHNFDGHSVRQLSKELGSVFSRSFCVFNVLDPVKLL